MTRHDAPSATQHTIAIQQVQQILQGVPDAATRDALMHSAGLMPALLESPLARVTQSQYARLIRRMTRRQRDEFWGLCSQPLPMGSFATGCRLLIAQPNANLKDATLTGLRYYHQLLPDFVPRLHVQGHSCCLRITPTRALDARGLYALRVFMFFSYGLMCWLVARRIPLTEVMYGSAEHARGSEGSRLFQAPLRHTDGEWGLFFDTRWLDLPVVQTPQSLQEFLAQAPANLLVKYRDQASLSERIRRLLRRYLAEEMPSLETVSDMLAMTPQTLRRRLQREGLGYQALKDALRRDVALWYLTHSELPLIEVANQVGFSEASTFHRAFKAWTGLTPGAYRSAHQG